MSLKRSIFNIFHHREEKEKKPLLPDAILKAKLFPLLDEKAARTFAQTSKKHAQLFKNIQAGKSVIYPVAHGKEQEAEAMLIKLKEMKVANHELAKRFDVTDIAGRIFKNITAFQYAVWALDTHMWKMLLKFMLPEQVRSQLKELEEKGVSYTLPAFGDHEAEEINGEKNYDLSPLLLALINYIQNFDRRRVQENIDFWCQEIGGAQRLVPAHVAQEFCWNSSDYLDTLSPWNSLYKLFTNNSNPNPDSKVSDGDAKLSRTLSVDRHLLNERADLRTTWFGQSGVLGVTAAIYRGRRAQRQYVLAPELTNFSVLPADASQDLKFLISLNKKRNEDLANLKRTYLNLSHDQDAKAAYLFDSDQKEEKQPLLESKNIAEEALDSTIKSLCNHIRTNLSIEIRGLDESDILLTPIAKCELSILQQTLKQLTKEEQQNLLIRAIQAPEATVVVEQLITAGIERENKDILFEAMKADAQLHFHKEKKQEFISNEKTQLLLQKGFAVDQSHLNYAAKNIRDSDMVALLLKQPSITIKMIKECLEGVEKISLQNKEPVSIPILTTQLHYEPIIQTLQKGLQEREEEQNKKDGQNNFRCR